MKHCAGAANLSASPSRATDKSIRNFYFITTKSSYRTPGNKGISFIFLLPKALPPIIQVLSPHIGQESHLPIEVNS